jgi:hypothetical protein
MTLQSTVGEMTAEAALPLTTPAGCSTDRVSNEVLVFATQGTNHGDGIRALRLASEVDSHHFPFDRGAKVRSAWRLLRTIVQRRPAMVLMEGTGIGGGLAVMAGRLVAGVPYVVSSGDAVGPYLSARMPLLTPAFAIYERLLCRLSAGFIGWTPYLVGRALSFGAPRAMTAAGWDECPRSSEDPLVARRRVRAQFGIAENEIVFGIAGSLAWTRRYGYCYGRELVEAVKRIDRGDVRVLIVGDGTGQKHLERLAGAELGRKVILSGRVAREDVPAYLAAMDIGSLPQSVDGVGSFRYTIKLSEYISAALPIVTGQIPLAYDLDDGGLWRLPGSAPWDARYITALAKLMQGMTAAEIAARRALVPRNTPLFDRNAQVRRVTAFLQDILECAASPA